MKKSNFFWVGYSDLLTSLLFVMLVLFVITFAVLKKKQSEIEIEIERLRKIVNIEKQFDPFINHPDFVYDEKCQKFYIKQLMGIEMFEPDEIIIKPQYRSVAISSGNKILEFIKTLYEQNNEFSYLLVIEGNVANTWDKKFSSDSRYGYETSYKRALSVYNLWIENNISFREYNVEVLITGSGFNGLCRDDEIEENNKRFSVQIIPKTGSFVME
ncbi:MAG: hypothetical protein H0X63_06500 [Flavobacteriales bacterium]|nr:hypothetical protein [Flavobacteriales bacterium]